VDELKGLIQDRYPAATFEVAPEEDPDGIYLRATVDVEDIDEVVDIFIDKLLEIQVERRLPVYVMPVRPIERVLEEIRHPRRKARTRIELEEMPLGPQL
jgi:hypothetical protein